MAKPVYFYRLFKKKVSRNTFAFWIRAVISEAYRTASEGDYTVVNAKVHRSIVKVSCSFLRRTLQSSR